MAEAVDMDPDAAAAFATGADPTDARDPSMEPGGNHALAEGHASPKSSLDGIWDALSRTEPSPRLETVESPFDLARGGPSRVMRGIMKATGHDGMPAWADLILGTLETVLQMQAGQGQGQSQGQQRADHPVDEPDVEVNL